MVARSDEDRTPWMTPAAVAAAVGGRLVRGGRPAVQVRTDSRELEPGDLFVALRGERCDGHDFVRTAQGWKISRLYEQKCYRMNVPDWLAAQLPA